MLRRENFYGHCVQETEKNNLDLLGGAPLRNGNGELRIWTVDIFQSGCRCQNIRRNVPFKQTQTHFSLKRNKC